MPPDPKRCSKCRAVLDKPVLYDVPERCIVCADPECWVNATEDERALATQRQDEAAAERFLQSSDKE